MEEIWKPVKGYEKYYEVSNLGRIKSLARTVYWKNRVGGVSCRLDNEKIMAPDVLRTGYVRVKFRVNGNIKSCTVHRVVAEHFIDNPLCKPCVNHKDGDRTNNNVENLEWCTYSENNLHEWRVLGRKSYRSKKIKCVSSGDVFDSVSDAAKCINVCKQTLFKAMYKNNGVCRGLVFEFV